MKKLLIPLLLLMAVIVSAQQQKIIKVVDLNDRPIPFVKVALSGPNMLLSDSAGAIVLSEQVERDVRITFSHSAFYSKNIAIEELKDTVYLVAVKAVHNTIIANGLPGSFVPPVQTYQLPVSTTFDMDYTFKPNFIMLYDQNAMKYQYHPQHDKTKYYMPSFSLAHQHFQNIKADSFNPHGASMPSQAVVGGASDFLFFLIAK